MEKNNQITNQSNNNLQILTKHWTIFYQEIQKINKIEECIYSGSPSLVKISKELSKNEAVGFISKLISKINLDLNIGKKMSPEQIFSVSEMILKEYYYLSLPEINMCLNQGFLGKYGQIYDRFDGMIIFEWLKCYSLQRDEVVITKNSNDKIEYEKKFNDIILPILKNISSEVLKPKEEPKREKPKYYDMHQRWIKQFEKLANGRFINRYGKIMNMDEFFNYKMEQLSRVNNYLNNYNI